MSEPEIPEYWVGKRIRVEHAHRASSHTEGELLQVGVWGIAIEGGELVRFFPWNSVASIQEAYQERGER